MQRQTYLLTARPVPVTHFPAGRILAPEMRLVGKSRECLSLSVVKTRTHSPLCLRSHPRPVTGVHWGHSENCVLSLMPLPKDCGMSPWSLASNYTQGAWCSTSGVLWARNFNASCCSSHQWVQVYPDSPSLTQAHGPHAGVRGCRGTSTHGPWGWELLGKEVLHSHSQFEVQSTQAPQSFPANLSCPS